jgi:hypothetical protein
VNEYSGVLACDATSLGSVESSGATMDLKVFEDEGVTVETSRIIQRMLRHTPEGRSPLSRGYEGLKLVL